jgi:hypothetical protein
MKHLIVVAGVILISGPAFAGMSCLDNVTDCLTPGNVASCLEQNVGMSGARAEKVAACFKRHGFNGKSITEKQWLACGLPKRGLQLGKGC